MSGCGVSCEARRLSLLAVLVGARRPLPMVQILRLLPDFYLPKGRHFKDQDERTQERVRRMFTRDIAFLRSMGYRIRYLPGAWGEHGYRLENLPRRNDSMLSRDELAMLQILGSIRPLFRESPLDEDLRMAFARIEALAQNLRPESLNDSVVFSLREFGRPTLAPRVPDDLLASVLLALREGSPVEMTYRSAHGLSPRTRRVDPWGIFLKSGVWYLVGWCHLRKDRRTFALHRAIRIEPLSGPREVPPPEGFSIARLASLEPWEIPVHDPVEVTLELDGVVSGLRHSRLRSATVLRNDPDGPWILGVRATNVEPLIGLVLSLWGHARILHPPEIRRRLEDIVDRLVRDHEEECA